MAQKTDATGCLSAALGYARRGWRVLPVRAGSKVPVTVHGVNDATTNEATIHAWWERRPSAGVTIAMGAVSDVMVLDVCLPASSKSSSASWTPGSTRTARLANSTKNISKNMRTGFWNAHRKRSRRSEPPGQDALAHAQDAIELYGGLVVLRLAKVRHGRAAMNAKGARAERRARRMLEQQGYCVVRAGGSLGLFDLVGIRCDGLRLIQVKCNRGPGRAERARLRAFDNLPPGSTRELWISRNHRTRPEVIQL